MNNFGRIRELADRLKPLLSRIDLIKNLLSPQVGVAAYDEDRLFHMPEYSTDGSNGMDLFTPKAITLRGGEEEVISTNLSFEMPVGWVGLILPRSGLGFKHHVRLVNTIGVIDSDFRGEVLVKISMPNLSKTTMMLDPEDKFVQMLMVWAPQATMLKKKYEDLSDTSRGEGGLGHTG